MKYYAVVIFIFVMLMSLGYGSLHGFGIELNAGSRAVLSLSGLIISHLWTRKFFAVKT